MTLDTEQFVQVTLAGEETDAVREKPGTFMWCPETEQWVLRSFRFDWPQELVDAPGDGKGDEKEESEPEKVGAMYEITLSYNVDYRFRVPAWSEHEAKDCAEELVLESSPCDRHSVHSQ